MTESKNKTASDTDSNISGMKSPEQNKSKSAPTESKKEQAGIGGPTAAEAAQKSADEFAARQKAKRDSRDEGN